jgi:uncharacterized heparinase superfamily protein
LVSGGDRSSGGPKPSPLGRTTARTRMEISLIRRRTIRTLRDTGPNPVLVARLAVHRTSNRWQQRRLRSAYSRIVCSGPPSDLVLPAIRLDTAEQWPIELSPALDELRAEYDAALVHTVDLLGSGPVSLGEEIDWHRDFKTGFRWPECFYQDVVVTRLDDDSDAKVPWELSRCHQLLVLGRAAAVFADEAAAAELEDQLRSWLDANPPGIGINWTNPMEVAIRAMNWIWALASMDNLRPLQPDLRLAVARSLAVHGRHIWHNLEGSPQLRSNHYLSDIVGLLAIGSVLADDPLAKQWTHHASRALEREARTQILPDGVDFEASLSYHGLVLELMLVGRLAAFHAGRPLSEEFDETLRRMLSVSWQLRHPDGRIPQFGDCDSGRVLPATHRRPPSHDNLLWLGSATLGTEPPEAVPTHEEVAFNLGLPAWRDARTMSELTASSPTRARSFPDAGIHVMRGAGTHLAVRCGDVGQNGNGGHSHNDLLAFELSIDGALVVADPGTYCYTSDPTSRNRFRSTAAHSTVMIEDQEINPIEPTELFRLPRCARPLPFQLAETDELIRLTCSHDGYRRLAPGAVVRRTFMLSRITPKLAVVDEIVGEGEYRTCSHLQLAPQWSIEASGPAAFCLRSEQATLSIEVFGHSEISVLEGWVSPRFGVREPALRLRIDVAKQAQGRFGYHICGEEQ